MKNQGLTRAFRRFTTATSAPTTTSVAEAYALRVSPGACSSSSGDASRSDSSDNPGDIVALAKAFAKSLDEDQFEDLNQHYSFNNAAASSDLPQGILIEAIAGATRAEKNRGCDEKFPHQEADDHLADTAHLHAARPHMARISHTKVAAEGPGSDLDGTDAP